MTLTPAYGRDYKSKKAVLTDWNGNKDFIIASVGPWMGAYVNKEQLPGETVTIRYSKLSKAVVV